MQEGQRISLVSRALNSDMPEEGHRPRLIGRGDSVVRCPFYPLLLLIYHHSRLRLELGSQIEPYLSWTAPKLLAKLEIQKPTRWYGNFRSRSRQASRFLMQYTPSQITAGRKERPRLPSGGRVFKIRTLPGTGPRSRKKRTTWANVRSIGKVTWNCTNWMWRRKNWRK